MASPSKFQGASGNLRRVFDQNQKRYRDLINSQATGASRELSPHHQRVRDIKSFCIKFLHLMDILYNLGGSKGTNSMDPKELQSLCQTVLKEFDFAMFHPMPEDRSSAKLGEEKMAYLEDEMVFKIVVLITIVVHKLQSQGSKQVAAAIALNLAVLSHILNHTLTRLQTAFYEAENPAFSTKELDEPGLGAESSNYIGHTQLSDEELDRRIKQKLLDEERSREPDSDDDYGDISRTEAERKMARLKRRRRRRTDEDLSEGEDEIPQDEVLTMISDDEEEMNFLMGAVDSSSSDDDENPAMISQELRPDFYASAASSAATENLETQALQMYANSSSSMTLHNLLSATLPTDYVGNEADLQRMSSDLLSMSVGDHQPAHQSAHHYSSHYSSSVDDIAHGKKQVSVPPGFDMDPEAQHVTDISQKLASFTIDTDTNSSIHTGSDPGDSTETESMIDRTESRDKQCQHILSVLSDQGLLCVIKVLCDWLICQPQIINTCIQSSPMLWSRLSYFLNFLPLESMIVKPDLYRSSALLSHIDNLRRMPDSCWKQTYPMREDINLYKLPVMTEAHSSLQFNEEIQLSSMEEALLRICCLRNFGYKMAALTGSSFTYNKEKRMFFGPSSDSSNQDPDTQVKMEDMDAKRNQLMKDMAQLRLQAEVSQLKDSVHSGMNRNLPPYLVPDSTALLDTMHLIKHLVYSAKFIIIIPLCVIDQLDSMKKESGNARDAIRWLEAEFRKGNMYIRAQKSHERLTNTSQRNLRRKDKDFWRMLQIVDCCKYLSEQTPECHTSGMVSVLTNENFSTHTSVRVKQIIQQIQQQGLVIHKVADFYSKWKEQWKKKG